MCLLVLQPSISTLLQRTAAFCITKGDDLLLQSATILSQCAGDRYYKVQRLLQSATKQSDKGFPTWAGVLPVNMPQQGGLAMMSSQIPTLDRGGRGEEGRAFN